MRGLHRTATFLLAVLALGGCSLGADDEDKPRPAPRATQEIAAAVKRLEDALQRRDFFALCQTVLSDAARRRAGGRDCPRSLREQAGEVRRPRIRLLEVTMRGRRASARVRTRAVGQAAIDDTIDLVRTPEGYRVEALAG